jgi:hypothetical protein
VRRWYSGKKECARNTSQVVTISTGLGEVNLLHTSTEYLKQGKFSSVNLTSLPMS